MVGVRYAWMKRKIIVAEHGFLFFDVLVFVVFKLDFILFNMYEFFKVKVRIVKESYCRNNMPFSWSERFKIRVLTSNSPMTIKDVENNVKVSINRYG